ncbi:uncharacterized protein Z518_11146 [Rhinocladiella mackenziei CBS 650.93]|uniref:Rhinocladiella mackenziei CBS 650.93 unplaced genomic scaffold supercont1.11, whole genome shotgun sequence n=1 Tax=Rhinocladiella mackenziei CBS 650.93 TaxID=1442369 RepID=A0A0D2I1W5_9EURO|nr:uncharacterized protein Z518_11146 [Rhinocladiella mackenziei CBS 650.93]KIW99733.1 hypothetical protein Z518_11146 [Rhinocladiella mackenziei CBS 650.93]
MAQSIDSGAQMMKEGYLKTSHDKERRWSKLRGTLKRILKVVIAYPRKHAPHHQKRRFTFFRKCLDEPIRTQPEDPLTCDGSSGLETISTDTGDKPSHKSKSYRILEKLLDTNIWVKGLAGTKEKLFGLKVDTGADKNLVIEEITEKACATLGVEPQLLKEALPFRLPNGQLTWARRYIKLHWMRDGLSDKYEWPMSTFYILPAQAPGNPAPFEFLIGREGISELVDVLGREGIRELLQIIGLEDVAQPPDILGRIERISRNFGGIDSLLRRFEAYEGPENSTSSNA